MCLHPPSPAGINAGILAACLLSAVGAGMAAGAEEEILQPWQVLGTSGFHHAGLLSEIAVLPDGKRFLSSSRDGSARLWDLESGRELCRYVRAESDDIWGVVLLPGGRELLTAGGDGYVTRWDLESGKELRTYQHQSTVFRLAVRPGGKEFVATDNKNVAILWDIESGEKRQTFKGHLDSVYTAFFTADGSQLLTGGSDGKLKVWDVESGKCTRTFGKDLEDVYTIVPSPDRGRFAMCSADDCLRVFETDSLEVVWKRKFEDDIKVAAWSPDGKRIATACEDSLLYLLEAQKGKVEKTISVEDGYHTPVVFTADGKGLISGGDYMLYHYDLESGDRVVPAAGDPTVRKGVDALAISPDGGRLFVAGGEDVIRVWNTGAATMEESIDLAHSVGSVAVSASGTMLATGESDGVIRLRSLPGAKVVGELRGEGSIEQVVFTGNDTRIISGGTDDQAHLWDVATGTRIRSFVGHGNDVNDVVVSKDGRILATVSDDKTARLWELETGKLLREFDGIDDNLYGAASLADGRSFLITPHEPELWGWLAPTIAVARTQSEEEIDRLVAQLSAEEFSERDAATKALIAGGLEILPLLEERKPDHPEASYRLRQVRSKIRSALYEGEVEVLTKFERDLSGLTSDPSGRWWAAAVGLEADSKVVVGEVRDGKLHVLQEVSDGHSPRHLAFSADGKILATGNRDGSVSLFRFVPGE